MINVKLPAGKYVVAVSGGVDSMSLLDILRRQKNLQLIVTHINHGIRKDSVKDASLVKQFTMSHNITYESKLLHLGAASEETARKARYEFLRYCRNKYKARAVVVAHHQGDMIETAIMALRRGTGWRGIAPFVNNKDIVRPLLNTTKDQLIAYARAHNVPWREDSTNRDETYTRNYVRYSLVPELDQRSLSWHTDLLRLIRKQRILRRKIEGELDAILESVTAKQKSSTSIERYFLIMTPHLAAYEILQHLIKNTTGNTLERPPAEAALLFAKVAKPGKRMPLGPVWQLRATTRQLIVEPAGT